MKTLITTLILILLLSTGLPAQGDQSAPRPSSGKKAAAHARPSERFKVSAWRLKLTSSGGISGRGGGEVTITSRGEVVAGRPPAGGQLGPSCEGKLRPSRLRAIAQAVLSARPAAWRTRYVDPQNPDGCCDQFSYQLELELSSSAGARPQTYTTGWHEGSRKLLPKELREMVIAATSAHQYTLDNCKQ